MTTKTLAGPKIKTALPGPNAKRVLAGDEKYHFAVLHPFLPAGGQAAAAASWSPTWTATSFSISPPASP